MSRPSLKPCPFCGHELDEKDAHKTVFGARVQCWYCGAIGPDPFPRFADSEGKTHDQVLGISAEWWNKRAGDSNEHK